MPDASTIKPTLTLHDGTVLPDTLFGVTNDLKIIPMFVVDVENEPAKEDDQPAFFTLLTEALNPDDNAEHGLYWSKIHAYHLNDLGGTVFLTHASAKANAVRQLQGRISQQEQHLAALRQQLLFLED